MESVTARRANDKSKTPPPRIKTITNISFAFVLQSPPALRALFHWAAGRPRGRAPSTALSRAPDRSTASAARVDPAQPVSSCRALLAPRSSVAAIIIKHDRRRRSALAQIRPAPDRPAMSLAARTRLRHDGLRSSARRVPPLPWPLNNRGLFRRRASLPSKHVMSPSTFSRHFWHLLRRPGREPRSQA